MTYEHVPPRITFNKTTRFKEVSFLKLLQSEDPFNYKDASRIEQGGVGYYSLCKDCNSYLGSKYVPAFNSYSNSFISLATKESTNYFEIEMYDFEVLKVLKQTIAIFLVVNPVSFSKTHKALREFVLNYELKELSSRYRIFIYLNSEGQLRNIPLMISGNLNSPVSIAASEIAFPPLGHIITIDFLGDLPFHHEITNFKNSDIEEKRSEVFKIYRLPTYLPLLLDYRNKSTIENTIKNSNT